MKLYDPRSHQSVTQIKSTLSRAATESKLVSYNQTTMHPTSLLLALGFALATGNAAPLSNPTPTMHPLFTVVSRIPESTASEVANATAGKSPNHKHTPDCKHNSNVNHNSTANPAQNSTTEDKSHAMEGEDLGSQSLGDPSPYPGFNASSHDRPHTVQAHNHTGCYRKDPCHSNSTATDAVYEKTAYSEKVKASGDSLHTHTGYRCAHPSHRNGTTTGDNSYDKRSVSGIDVTVCLGAACKDSELVTAKVNDAGKLTEIETKNSKRIVRREDRAFSYEDLTRQMSGAHIAGGL